MASLSYGKRMLKAGLQKSGYLKKSKRISPDEDAKNMCIAGLDKDGFDVRYISDYKGFGVFATRQFKSGDFLLQYCGEKISKEEGEKRLAKSTENKIFFYSFKGKYLCIDAEGTTGHICQYVNDAADGNSVMKLKVFNDTEFLCLFAKHDIMPGDELLYDYGDAMNSWWRKKNEMVKDEFTFDSDSDPFEINSVDYVSDSDISETVPFPELHVYQNAVPDTIPGPDTLSIPVPDTVPVPFPDTVSLPVLDTVPVPYNVPALDTVSVPVTYTVPVPDTVPVPVPYTVPVPDTVPVPVPYTAPAHDTVSVPVPGTVPIPVPDTVPVPFPDTVSLPVSDTAPVPVPDTVPVPVPYTVQVPDTLPVPVPYTVPVPDTVPVPVPYTVPVTVPDTVPVPDTYTVPIPVPDSVSVPVPDTAPVPDTFPEQLCKVLKHKNKKKPDRYCIYCKAIIPNGKLKRHILRKHKSEQEVRDILKQDTSVQNKFFDLKRREGIFEYNTLNIAEGEEPKMRERKPKLEDQLRYCSCCKGFFSNKYFFKHKCVDIKPQPLKPVLLQNICDETIASDTEFKDILNRFRDGEVGDLCRTNKTIQLIGYRHFNLRRFEDGKEDEVRKVVMSDMRELSRLFLTFKSQSSENRTVEDMFNRLNLPDLTKAVKQLVKDDKEKKEKHGQLVKDDKEKKEKHGQLVKDDKEKKEKHGQKLMLDAVILRSVKTLLGHYSETMQDDKRKELKCFKTAYKHKSCEMYPSAREACRKNSLEKARKPSELPDEQALKQLKGYIGSTIQHILQNFDIQEYALLRNLVVARLTLYNARRGEEAARMLLSEWKDAEKGVWLPDDQIEKIDDPAEQYLVGKFKIAFLKGKGRKFVPVLVPIDLVQAIEILMIHRIDFGIKDQNKFLFGTRGNYSHCSGWHAVENVCKNAGVVLKVNATKIRHRLSSVFASLDMNPQHQKLFLDHMGHDANINKENYQCPQGLQMVRVMGKMLNSVDEGLWQKGQDAIQNADTCIADNEEPDRGTRRNVKATGDLNIAEIQNDDSTVDEEMHEEEHNSRRGQDISGGTSTDDEEMHVEERRNSRGRDVSVKWSIEDTKSLKQYFKDDVFGGLTKNNNQGKLPSKRSIMTFLAQKDLKSLDGFSLQKKYMKIRTKLFNERKSVREKTFGTFKKMCY